MGKAITKLLAIMEIHSRDVVCASNDEPILFVDEETALAYGDANLGDDWTKEYAVVPITLTVEVDVERLREDL